MVRMAHHIHIRQKFEDFRTFESALERYQNLESVQFYKRDSRTVEKAQPRITNRKLNARLKYYEITYSCFHGGKKFKSRGAGLRESIYLSILNDTANDTDRVFAIFSKLCKAFKPKFQGSAKNI